MAYFGIQKRRYYLKELLKKRKTAVFRKRVSAKTAVFSVFKSVNLVGKSDDTQDLSAAGALAKVKVSSYTRMI
jgi:hypothetical protein